MFIQLGMREGIDCYPPAQYRTCTGSRAAGASDCSIVSSADIVDGTKCMYASSAKSFALHEHRDRRFHALFFCQHVLLLSAHAEPLHSLELAA